MIGMFRRLFLSSVAKREGDEIRKQEIAFKSAIHNSLSDTLLIISDSMHNSTNHFVADIACLMRLMSGGYGQREITFSVDIKTDPCRRMKDFILHHGLDGFSYSDLFLVALRSLSGNASEQAISEIREAKENEHQYHEIVMDFCRTGDSVFKRMSPLDLSQALGR